MDIEQQKKAMIQENRELCLRFKILLMERYEKDENPRWLEEVTKIEQSFERMDNEIRNV